MNTNISFKIRPATEEDLPVLTDLIKKLADIYTATPELYRRYGFGEEAIRTRLREDGRAACHYHHL